MPSENEVIKNETNKAEKTLQEAITDVYPASSFDIEKFSAALLENGITQEDDLVIRSQTEENLLGTGGNGSVYKIPGMEGFVLKIYHGGLDEKEVTTGIELAEDMFPDINLGQPVAYLKGGVILKEQHGMPAGVPYGEVRRNKEVGNIVYHEHLKIAANLPQSSYDQLAALFLFLNEYGVKFDPSKANNLLIDTTTNKINVVDLNFEDTNKRYLNTLSYMVIPLLDNSYAWQVEDPSLEPELVSLRSEILAKCVSAAEKADLPAPSPTDSSLKYSFELAGMSDVWEEYVAKHS